MRDLFPNRPDEIVCMVVCYALVAALFWMTVNHAEFAAWLAANVPGVFV